MKQKPIHPSMQPYLEGQVILLDKPLRWTSFDAIRKLRRLTGVNKIGHAGTLDPLATGLLIICTGSFTKKINEYMAQPKEYTGIITLGATTATYDLESTPENIQDISHLSKDLIEKTTEQFTGEILQTPPIHSAIKQDGKPVYLAARKGQDVQLEPRKITIYKFSIEKIELPDIHFRVACSTGTYIRSLANDFGAALGVGGHLSKLCRTKIGDYTLENAVSIDALEEKLHAMKRDVDTANTTEKNI